MDVGGGGNCAIGESREKARRKRVSDGDERGDGAGLYGLTAFYLVWRQNCFPPSTRARPACRVPLSLIVAVPDACLFGSSDQSQDLAPRPGSSDWKLWAADPAADPTHPVKAAQSCLSTAEFCGRSWSLSHRPPTKTRPSDGPSCDAKSGTLMSVSLPLSENQSGQSVCSPFLPIIIP